MCEPLHISIQVLIKSTVSTSTYLYTGLVNRNVNFSLGDSAPKMILHRREHSPSWRRSAPANTPGQQTDVLLPLLEGVIHPLSNAYGVVCIFLQSALPLVLGRRALKRGPPEYHRNAT
jgi:hypothetical protein